MFVSSRRFGPSLAALALGLGLGACDKPEPAPSSEAAAKSEPSKPSKPSEPAPPPAVEPTGEDAVSEGEPALDPPPWFRADAFDHVEIRNQSHSQTPEGKTSSLLLLELEAGTSVEQCIAAAEAKLGESIDELPARANTPQGYLSIMGRTSSYAFNVVCGEAKGVPTMYLSYSR